MDEGRGKRRGGGEKERWRKEGGRGSREGGGGI